MAPQAGLKFDTGSGIQGKITRGPICPVQRWPADCPEQPLQATLSIQDEAGNEVARVQSSPDGSYSIELNPGTFVVVAQPVTNSAAGSSPQPLRWPMPPAAFVVTVSSDLWASIDLSYDTGIR